MYIMIILWCYDNDDAAIGPNADTDRRGGLYKFDRGGFTSPPLPRRNRLPIR